MRFSGLPAAGQSAQLGGWTRAAAGLELTSAEPRALPGRCACADPTCSRSPVAGSPSLCPRITAVKAQLGGELSAQRRACLVNALRPHSAATLLHTRVNSRRARGSARKRRPLPQAETGPTSHRASRGSAPGPWRLRATLRVLPWSNRSAAVKVVPYSE